MRKSIFFFQQRKIIFIFSTHSLLPSQHINLTHHFFCIILAPKLPPPSIHLQTRTNNIYSSQPSSLHLQYNHTQSKHLQVLSSVISGVFSDYWACIISIYFTFVFFIKVCINIMSFFYV